MMPQAAAESAGVYNLVFHPDRFWRDSLLRKNFLFAAVFLFFCYLFDYLAFFSDISAFAAMIPFFFLDWLLSAAVYHLCAVSLGGRGSIVSFLYSWAFTSAPLLFLPAIRIFGETLFGGSFAFLLLASLAIFLWIFVLRIRAVKFNYRVNSARAVSILVVPFVFVFVLFAVSLVFYSLFLLI